jgi:hypothetical protein
METGKAQDISHGDTEAQRTAGREEIKKKSRGN